jgi:hypothetical protein
MTTFDWGDNPTAETLDAYYAHVNAFANAQDVIRLEQANCRTVLTNALAATQLSLATSEEQAIRASQVEAALESFVALVDPPVDIVSQAASLVSWKAVNNG